MAGLENILAEELRAIGAENIEILSRAVKFQGDKVLLYLSNLKCATALRVLLPVLEFPINSQDDFYNFLLRQDWQQWLDVDDTFAIDSAVKSRHFPHSHFPALRMKDAIADHFMNKFAKRPSVDLEKPNLRFNLFISGDKVSVSLDSSGYSLHKRGFRLQKSRAPINEVLAAGILRIAGWDGSVPLLDPMCGTATFLQEAALLYTGMPPGWKKTYFGFFSWKDFDEKLWENVRKIAAENMRPLPDNLLYGTDADKEQIEIAAENIKAMGFEKQIQLKQISFADVKKPTEQGVIIMNPPYGERLRPKAILDMYKEMGDKLKQDFGNWEAWILSSNIEALKNIGLKTDKRVPLYNGPLLCSLRKYNLYKGSKRVK
ncbi:MAG: THUMP domain-containing protein [Chitinophagales bacterium]